MAQHLGQPWGRCSREKEEREHEGKSKKEEDKEEEEEEELKKKRHNCSPESTGSSGECPLSH